LIDLPEEEVRDLARLTEKLSLEEINSLFRSLLVAHDEVARSAFPRLVLEMTLIRVTRRRPILSVEEVLEKLRVMEERLLGRGTVSAPSRAKELASPVIVQVEDDPDSPLTAEEEEPEPPAPAKPEKEKEIDEGEEKRSERLTAGVPGELGGIWREFVHFAKKKKPPFASLLEHGYPLALENDLLRVGYPEKSFYLERMEEADNRSLLGTLGAEYFKRPLRVQVVGLKADAVPSGYRANAEEEKGRKKNSRNEKQEALNHPLVREAINIFGGRVVEIKDL
jgi:DNA polymerase-3 subunit gamma/tau